jgi:hypothetical protein
VQGSVRSISRPRLPFGNLLQAAWSVSEERWYGVRLRTIDRAADAPFALLYAPPRIISWGWRVSNRHHIAYRAIFILHCRLSSSAGTLARSDRRGSCLMFRLLLWALFSLRLDLFSFSSLLQTSRCERDSSLLSEDKRNTVSHDHWKCGYSILAVGLGDSKSTSSENVTSHWAA